MVQEHVCLFTIGPRVIVYVYITDIYIIDTGLDMIQYRKSLKIQKGAMHLSYFS